MWSCGSLCTGLWTWNLVEPRVHTANCQRGSTRPRLRAHPSPGTSWMVKKSIVIIHRHHRQSMHISDDSKTARLGEIKVQWQSDISWRPTKDVCLTSIEININASVGHWHLLTVRIILLLSCQAGHSVVTLCPVGLYFTMYGVPAACAPPFL